MRRRLSACAAIIACALGTLASLDCTSSSDPPTVLDTDGDGLSDRDEVALYGTSPVMADTDGDGWSDFAEVVGHAFDPANDPYRFNPRVSDVPEQALEFTSAPIIVIMIQRSDGESITFETERSDLMGETTTVGNSRIDRQSNTLDTSDTVSQTVTDGTGDPSSGSEEPRDAGADADAGDAGDAGDGSSAAAAAEMPPTISTTVSHTISPSNTVDVSLTFSAEDAEANATTLTQIQSYLQSKDTTGISASLKITGILTNRGHVAFRITNLILSATMVDESTDYFPLGNLTIDTTYSTYDPFALSPGEQERPHQPGARRPQPPRRGGHSQERARGQCALRDGRAQRRERKAIRLRLR